MKTSLKKITDLKIYTKDKSSGKIQDLLFDEKRWVVRYFEASFGSLFSARRVLIPKAFWGTPDWQNEEVSIPLSDAEIDNCPDIGSHKSVSREYEEKLHKYYAVNPYWSMTNIGMASRLFPPRPIPIPEIKAEDRKVSSFLRSFSEICGYGLHALDGRIGHVDDLLVDIEDWQLVYLIVDTSNWLPWSKKVMIPVEKIDQINYIKQEISIRINKASIENAPGYNPVDPISGEMEAHVFDFFSRSLVK